jgi:hypothetical protein
MLCAAMLKYRILGQIDPAGLENVKPQWLVPNVKSYFIMRWQFCADVFCSVILGWPVSASEQTPLNVSNYGAKGHLLTLGQNITVNNSTTVVCPGADFLAADL